MSGHLRVFAERATARMVGAATSTRQGYALVMRYRDGYRVLGPDDAPPCSALVGIPRLVATFEHGREVD